MTSDEMSKDRCVYELTWLTYVYTLDLDRGSAG